MYKKILLYLKTSSTDSLKGTGSKERFVHESDITTAWIAVYACN